MMEGQEFKPITTQTELNEVLSSRLKRERTTTNRKRAAELQDVIDQVDALADYLRDLQRRWTDGST